MKLRRKQKSTKSTITIEDAGEYVYNDYQLDNPPKPKVVKIKQTLSRKERHKDV